MLSFLYNLSMVKWIISLLSTYHGSHHSLSYNIQHQQFQFLCYCNACNRILILNLNQQYLNEEMEKWHIGIHNKKIRSASKNHRHIGMYTYPGPFLNLRDQNIKRTLFKSISHTFYNFWHQSNKKISQKRLMKQYHLVCFQRTLLSNRLIHE